MEHSELKHLKVAPDTYQGRIYDKMTTFGKGIYALCAIAHTKMDFKPVHPFNILSTDFITIYQKLFKMKNKHFFRRAITAALLCICFHSQFLYAQRLSVRLDAPQGVDAETLDSDIGSLQITFSNNPAFQNLSNYANECLPLSSNYNQGDANLYRYHSYRFTLNFYNRDDNYSAWWGISNIDMRSLCRAINCKSGDYAYYRIYSMHLNRIITGKILLSKDENVTISRNDLASARRVIFQPVIDRNGAPVSAMLAPDLRVGSCYGYSNNVINMEPYFNGPWALYALPGDILRYLVIPRSNELALHVDSITVADTPDQTITTDYRQAVECRFYITDSKGAQCPVDGTLNSVYYKEQKWKKPTNSKFYGYGFYNVARELTLTAPDGTCAAYVLPGTQSFQISKFLVKTSDPDFLTPCNADGGYIIKELTVPESTEPVNLSLGRSKPLKVTIALADAAPFADYIYFLVTNKVSRPYAWRDNRSMNVPTKIISREIKGNDVIWTMMVEGSTFPRIEIGVYNYEKETFGPTVESRAFIYESPSDQRTEFHLTQNDFSNGSKGLSFAELHPVKFIIPCHLLQGGKYRLHLSGKYGKEQTGEYDDVSTYFTHRNECAKSFGTGENPVPYDTLTLILPEGQYNWYMQNSNENEESEASIFSHRFTLTATDDLVQPLSEEDYTLLRVKDLGLEHVYTYCNNLPTAFPYYKCDLSKNSIVFADETIPLHNGYNEYSVDYRQVKIEKEADTSIGYTLKSPLFIGADDENPFHTSAIYYGRTSINSLGKQETTTGDSAILVSKNSQADLVLFYRNSGNNHIVRINPSSADTVVIAHSQKPVRVTFSYEQVAGVWINSLRQFDLFFAKERTRIIPYNYSLFERRKCTDLVPGAYSVSCVFLVDDVEHHVAADFIVEEDKPMTVELKEFDPTSITSPLDTNMSGKVKARYTIDGRQIAAPQRGLNILRMEDGSIRKVMVK